ncbi:pEARLI1-like lipid transfer protein 2 [Linum perenne]
MASKTNSTLALFLALNLLFFSMVSGTCTRESRATVPIVRRTPAPAPSRNSTGKCPINALKLGVCTNVLGNLLNITIGEPPVKPCCNLIEGLVDLEAAVCLCTAIKANILGINLNIPISLGFLLDTCNKNVSSGFQCPH